MRLGTTRPHQLASDQDFELSQELGGFQTHAIIGIHEDERDAAVPADDEGPGDGQLVRGVAVGSGEVDTKGLVNRVERRGYLEDQAVLRATVLPASERTANARFFASAVVRLSSGVCGEMATRLVPSARIDGSMSW